MENNEENIGEEKPMTPLEKLQKESEEVIKAILGDRFTLAKPPKEEDPAQKKTTTYNITFLKRKY